MSKLCKVSLLIKSDLNVLNMGRVMRKWTFRYMWPAKSQISLCTYAVWSLIQGLSYPYRIEPRQVGLHRCRLTLMLMGRVCPKSHFLPMWHSISWALQQSGICYQQNVQFSWQMQFDQRFPSNWIKHINPR